jgi:hypothetical protein
MITVILRASNRLAGPLVERRRERRMGEIVAEGLISKDTNI